MSTLDIEASTSTAACRRLSRRARTCIHASVHLVPPAPRLGKRRARTGVSAPAQTLPDALEILRQTQGELRQIQTIRADARRRLGSPQQM